MSERRCYAQHELCACDAPYGHEQAENAALHPHVCRCGWAWRGVWTRQPSDRALCAVAVRSYEQSVPWRVAS